MLEKLFYIRIVNYIYENKNILDASLEDIEILLGNLSDVGPQENIDTIRDLELNELAKFIKKFGTIGSIIKIDKFIKNSRYRRAHEDIDTRTRIGMCLMIEAANKLREDAEKICRSNIIKILYRDFINYLNGSFDEERFLNDMIGLDSCDDELLGFSKSSDLDEQKSLLENSKLLKESNPRKPSKPQYRSGTMILSCNARFKIERDFQSFIKNHHVQNEYRDFIYNIIELLNSKEENIYRIVAKIIMKIACASVSPKQKKDIMENQLTIEPINPHR